jgi:ribosomal protein S18 acetylase RimI-like enzyme
MRIIGIGMARFELCAQPSETRADIRVLDNPIWNALKTKQRELALGDGVVRRFPAQIGPLVGLSEQSTAAYDALRGIAEDGVTAQFLHEPWQQRAGWEQVRDGSMDQMLWTEELRFESELADCVSVRELTEEDASDMLALAKLTEPGPFGSRTHTLGRFFGVFEGERLVSMAGQRLHMPGFTEVSAVCTHPDARGKSYPRVAMVRVMEDILSRGETPMLHVFSANAPAIRVYRSLGFTCRRNLYLAVLKAG